MSADDTSKPATRRRIERVVQRRRPLRLEGWSPLQQLVLLAWYPEAVSETREAIGAAYAALKAAVRARDWDSIEGHTLVLSIDGAERRTRISYANSQFVSVDPALPLFRLGYEPEVEALLDLMMPQDGVFYDVGANWGYFSLYLASRPGFRGRIHAFEPAAATFGDLAGVVSGLGLEGMITCHRLAASDRNGTASFSEALFSGQSGLRDSDCGSETVQVARLDSLALPPPHVIKLDVEGAEAAALTGCLELLRRSKPAVIFENWLKDDTVIREPFDILSSLGYRFFYPNWKGQGHARFSPQLTDEGTEQILALAEFTVAHRAGLSEQINVVAAHADRIQA